MANVNIWTKNQASDPYSKVVSGTNLTLEIPNGATAELLFIQYNKTDFAIPTMYIEAPNTSYNVTIRGLINKKDLAFFEKHYILTDKEEADANLPTQPTPDPNEVLYTYKTVTPSGTSEKIDCSTDFFNTKAVYSFANTSGAQLDLKVMFYIAPDYASIFGRKV